MKITFLQSSLWLSGGARIVIEHANQLARRGHDVAVVIPGSAIDPEMAAAVRDEVQIIQAAYPLAKPELRRTTAWDKLRITLSMIAATPQSDIIIATHTPTTVVSFAACKLLGRGSPVWFYQDYPEMFAGRRLESGLLRNAMRWHRGALVVSQYSAAELRGIAGGDVRYVGQILNDYERFRAQADRPRDPNPRPHRIMYVGDFRPRKGLHDFLAAAQRVHESVPDLEVTLVLKEEGEFTLNVPHRIVRRPSPAELADCFGESDVFVSSSWHESFGLPPLEAMASGTTVVLTDSGGVRDYARPDENCLMVPAKDVDGLAAAIVRALEDPALAARLRAAGIETAKAFTVEKAAERMERALMEFVEK